MSEANSFIATANAKPGEGNIEDVIEDANETAWGKRYNLKFLGVSITETVGDKQYFDAGSMVWTGVSYGLVVAVEKELAMLIGKFVQLGGVVATGENPPVEPPVEPPVVNP